MYMDVPGGLSRIWRTKRRLPWAAQPQPQHPGDMAGTEKSLVHWCGHGVTAGRAQEGDVTIHRVGTALPPGSPAVSG